MTDAASRSELILDRLRDAHCRLVSRLFCALIALQWVACIVASLLFSPRTWKGSHSDIHSHVWLAVLLGGIVASVPVALALTRPTLAITRHTIAAAQMLFSALLIHLSAGRIETHFHVFVSLAFLAFYRDWRILVTASAVVTFDHWWRGMYWPASVFGTEAVSPWRWVEHAAWVVFEDIVLFAWCIQSAREMARIASHQAALLQSRDAVEHEVTQRTAELVSVAEALRSANTDLVASSFERERLHKQLVIASRQAGMAEVAVGVLHNLGNVLNSVNISATVVADQLRKSEVDHLARACSLLKEHRDDLGVYITTDPRGRAIPEFLIQVATSLQTEHARIGSEVQAIVEGIERVKQLIDTQHSNIGRIALYERVDPVQILGCALEVHAEALKHVRVETAHDDLGPVPLDKHHTLQILDQLVSNAIKAVDDLPTDARVIRVSIRAGLVNARPGVVFEVADNGRGIDPSMLDAIFSQGFASGPSATGGFGLHTAANAAMSLGGRLRVSSPGLGHGATFTLEIPTGERAREVFPVSADDADGHTTTTENRS